MRRMFGVEAAWGVAKLAGACLATTLASSCSTPLLNNHTLDLASTVDDVMVRQVVFNLAKTAQNDYALPSQVQIPQGQVTARTSVTPTVTVPVDNAVTSTSQLASQLVLATHALTNTGTTISTAQRNVTSTGVSGVVEDMENWNVNPVQDPEQLRRLQLLYEYGAGRIRAQDLLCYYPVPELSEDTAGAGKQGASKAKAPATRKTIYIRGEFAKSCVNIAAEKEHVVEWMLLGPESRRRFHNAARMHSLRMAQPKF